MPYKVQHNNNRYHVTVPSWAIGLLDNPKELSVKVHSDSQGYYIIMRGVPNA